MHSIGATRMQEIVESKFRTISGTYNAEDVRTILHDLGTAVIREMVDIDGEASSIVRADYKATLHVSEDMLIVPVGMLHSQRNIKTLQERTGADHMVARKAIEKAITDLYAGVASVALTNLESANSNRVSEDNPGARHYVNAKTHHMALSHLTEAANEVPF